jgi:glycosyltransferase involved in cell wall biosynthesis
MIYSFGIMQFIESIYVFRQLNNIEKNVLVVSGGFPSTHILQYILCKLSVNHNIIYNIHNYSYYNSIKNLFDFWFFFKISNIKIKVITVSNNCALNLRNNRYLSKFKSINYIYNPLRINNQLNKDSNITSCVKLDTIKICIVANFEPRKGHQYLIEIINNLESYKLSKFEFNLYGLCEGKYYKYLKNLFSKNFYNSKIFFHGFIENKEIIYNSNNISLVLSQDYESFGYSAAESLIFGLPVISTDTGALPEIIGSHGLIFEKMDFKKAASYIIYVTENFEHQNNNSDLRRKYALELFDYKKIRDQYKNEFVV